MPTFVLVSRASLTSKESESGRLRHLRTCTSSMCLGNYNKHVLRGRKGRYMDHSIAVDYRVGRKCLYICIGKYAHAHLC